MRGWSLWLGVAFAVGCSEYDIKKNNDPNNNNDSDTDTEDPDDTGNDPQHCEDFEEPDPAEVAVNEECDVEISTGTFTPEIEWKYGNGVFCGPPAVGQTIDTNDNGLLDDGDMPLIFLYQNGTVVAVYGDGSGVAWQTSDVYGQDGGFAVGDIDADGNIEVVTADATRVCALDGRDGSEVWCSGDLSSNLDPLGYNYPSIADMDGDGMPEVTCGSAILNGEFGTAQARGSLGKGAAPYGGTGTYTYGAMSVPIDIDGDGQLELIAGNTAYEPDGTVIWNRAVQPDGLVAVADFDGDGEGEIVRTSGIYVSGQETDGVNVWGPITYTGNLGAPAIDDLDGDGEPDFVFAAQNQLIAMHWGGDILWTAPIGDASGAAGPVLYDFEMDGYPEVLYADETTIRFFSGLDGSVKYTSGEHSSYTILETPVVADVDNDDHVEIVLGHCTGTSTMGAITVYGDADDSWPPGRKIWNQHAYQIVNVNSDGTIPSPTPSNFSEFNSFRSGDFGLPPNEWLDLRAEVLDVCEDECDDNDVVYVQARVLNAGNIEAPAGIPVTLYAGIGGEAVATEILADPIPSGGSSDAITFEASASDMSGHKPIVMADDDGLGNSTRAECDEANNAGDWEHSVCD